MEKICEMSNATFLSNLTYFIGPITQMAIVYHRSGDEREEIKNDPEMDNEDGIITYVYDKEGDRR